MLHKISCFVGLVVVFWCLLDIWLFSFCGFQSNLLLLHHISFPRNLLIFLLFARISLSWRLQKLCFLNLKSALFSIFVAHIWTSSTSYVTSYTSSIIDMASSLASSTSPGAVLILLIVVKTGVGIWFTHLFFSPFASRLFSNSPLSAFENSRSSNVPLILNNVKI